MRHLPNNHPNATSHSFARLRKRRQQNGFTLLEVILSLSIMTMLIGSIFSITGSSLSLSQDVIDNQNQQRHTSALNQYFDKLFNGLPRESKFELIEDNFGYQILNIQDPATFFPSAEKDLYALYLRINVVKNRDGLLSLNAIWSNDPELDPKEIREDQSIVLIDNLTDVKWEMYSIKDLEWYTSWTTNLPQPSHIRLTYISAFDDAQHSQTFWLPPTVEIQ